MIVIIYTPAEYLFTVGPITNYSVKRNVHGIMIIYYRYYNVTVLTHAPWYDNN